MVDVAVLSLLCFLFSSFDSNDFFSTFNKQQRQQYDSVWFRFICILKIKTIYECHKIHPRLNQMDCYCQRMRTCVCECILWSSIHYLLLKIIRVLSRSSSYINLVYNIHISYHGSIRTISWLRKKKNAFFSFWKLIYCIPSAKSNFNETNGIWKMLLSASQCHVRK